MAIDLLTPAYLRMRGLVMFALGDNSGGSDDDPDDDEDDDDAGDDDGDPDEGKTDAEIRAELASTRAALKKSNDNGLKARNRRKAAEARADALEAAKGNKPADDDAEAAVKAARDEGTKAERERSDGRLMRSEAKSALIAKGADAAKVKRLIALVDYSDLEVDDDGEVEGLEDAIDDLVSEYPELFNKPGARRRISGDSDDGKGRPRGKSATERQAAMLTGK